MGRTMLIIGLSLITFFLAVSGGFFAYVAVNPKTPDNDDKLHTGIKTMAGLSYLMFIFCVVMIIYIVKTETIM
jgi:hypothetical protein